MTRQTRPRARRPALDRTYLTTRSRAVLAARQAWREAPIGDERERLYELYMDARGCLAWTVIQSLLSAREMDASDGRVDGLTLGDEATA